MGFDIYAYDNRRKEIAYLRAYMGAFRMCREQGYDWFKLLDASKHDCGVSGCGTSKHVKLKDLQNALAKLETHDTKGKLGNLLINDEYRDEWKHRKPILKEFMQKCVDYCTENNRKTIRIHFS